MFWLVATVGGCDYNTEVVGVLWHVAMNLLLLNLSIIFIICAKASFPDHFQSPVFFFYGHNDLFSVTDEIFFLYLTRGEERLELLTPKYKIILTVARDSFGHLSEHMSQDVCRDEMERLRTMRHRIRDMDSLFLACSFRACSILKHLALLENFFTL